MSNQLFSEEEIQRIIKRAAELQQKENAQSSQTMHGLTLEELHRIGEDAGLSIQHIEIAALEIGHQKIQRHSGFSDTHIFEERDIETETNEDSIWDEVRAELRHNLGTGDLFGEIKEHPTQKEWSHRSLSGIETVASLSSRANGVKLRISQRVGLASSLTEGVMYGGVLTVIIFAAMNVALNPSFYEGTALLASLLVICSIFVYTLDVAWRKKKLRRLSEMMDKITRQIPTISSVKTGNMEQKIVIEDESTYDSTHNLANKASRTRST